MTHFFRRVGQAGLLLMCLPGAQAQPVAPSPDHLQLYRSRDCAQLKTSGPELEELFKRSEAQWNQPGLPNLSAEHRAYELQLRREGLTELEKKNSAARAALALAIAEKQCDNPASGVAPSPASRPRVVEAASASSDLGPAGDLGYYRYQDCPGLVRIQEAMQVDLARRTGNDRVFGDHHLRVISKYLAAKGCGTSAVTNTPAQPPPARGPGGVEPAGTNMPGALSPGGPAQPVIPSPVDLQIYRSRDCARLKTSAAEYEELIKRVDANGPRTDQWYVENVNSRGPARAALAMAIAEKQCDFAPSAVAPSPVPGAPAAQQPVLQAAPGAALPAKQAGAGVLPQLGARVDAVSPGFAQSLGLAQVRGALVVEVAAGSTAAKAGLRVLDVIVEITGQTVHGPDDLRETLSRMRPGFKAPLRVWRGKTMRDVAVEISESSRP